MTANSQPTPVAMLNVVGLVVAAVVFGPWRRAAVVACGALPAGIVAAKHSSRRAGVAGQPRGAQ